MLLWMEWSVALLLAASQPLWHSLFPLSASIHSSLPPMMLTLAGMAALLAAVGLLFARPRLRDLPRAVWNGWNTRVLGERTPSLPDISDPLLGVVYAPLFHPRQVQAGRMLVRGMDTTAALASCLILLLSSAAQVAACLVGDAPAGMLPFALFPAACFILWTIFVFCSIRAIGRPHQVTTKPSKEIIRPFWIALLPLLVLLYGFCSALIPLLSLRLDQSPVHGATAILYALIRALFFVCIQYLLLHAPAKLALLSAPQRPHLRPWTFYATSGAACFVWLLADYFHPIF